MRLIWPPCILLSMAMLALTGRSAWRGHAHARAADDRLGTARILSAEIAELRALVPLSARPGEVRRTTALPAHLAEVLASRGLSAAAITSFTGDSSGAGHPRAILILEGLTLPQLGAFLIAWREAEPAWMVSALEVSPKARDGPARGGDLPLHATLTLESRPPVGSTGEAP